MKPKPGMMRQALLNFEAEMIAEALDVSDGRRAAAARQLEIPQRTLERKIRALKRLGLLDSNR